MGSFSIVNNLSAISAQNRLQVTDRNLKTTLTRLSSGLRINNSGDDAAGLAIADGLRADVRALNQGARNANDGISLLQTSDSALNEISLMLTRAVTLAEQAASGTSGADNSESKTALDDEFQSILSEIKRLSGSVEFNGTKLLGDSSTSNGGSTGTASVTIQVGLDDSADARITIQTISVNVDGFQRVSNSNNPMTQAEEDAFNGFQKGTEGTDRIALNLGFANSDLKTSSNALAALSTLQGAISDVSRTRASVGASINRLQVSTTVINSLATNLQSAESQIRDANIAQEIVNLTQYQILTQTGISALAQANVSGQNVLALLR